MCLKKKKSCTKMNFEKVGIPLQKSEAREFEMPNFLPYRNLLFQIYNI